MLKHICGQCAQEFISEADYLSHECPTIERDLYQSSHPTTQPKVVKLAEKNIIAAVRAVRQLKKYG